MPAFTNATQSFALSVTNTDERRTVQFVGSIAEYHQTVDPDEPTSALAQWTQSLQRMLQPAPVSVVPWQDVEECVFLLEWWIGHGRADEAFAAATNLNEIVAEKTSTSPSVPLKRALLQYYHNIDLPLEQTFQYEAALSASEMGDYQTATNWATGLPARATEVIFAGDAPFLSGDPQ